MREKYPLELYVHIPFCVKKCDYCDFLSFPAGREWQKEYMRALQSEIRRTSIQKEKYLVQSVFFGGGTPSLPDAGWLTGILETLRETFAFAGDAEISLEMNPGTADREKLHCYVSGGFNRLSIGCQSMKDEELRRLGRIHDHRTFLRSYAMAREAGFRNINLDLMSALPGQTPEDWEETLREAAELGPEHIAAYSLILEEGTPFYEKRESLPLPDEDAEREMYEETADILAEYGYHQYEISNYALDGKECRHNVGYWTGVPYLGFGLGASSYIDRKRYHNTEDAERYLRICEDPERDLRCLYEEEEVLSDAGLQSEFMILGLRMNRGVSEKEFEKRFGCTADEIYHDIIEKYVRYGLLKREKGRIALTRRGLSLSNTVMADFLQDA